DLLEEGEMRVFLLEQRHEIVARWAAFEAAEGLVFRDERLVEPRARALEGDPLPELVGEERRLVALGLLGRRLGFLLHPRRGGHAAERVALLRVDDPHFVRADGGAVARWREAVHALHHLFGAP